MSTELFRPYIPARFPNTRNVTIPVLSMHCKIRRQSHNWTFNSLPRIVLKIEFLRIMLLPSKTTMSPENQWLEDEFPFAARPMFTGYVSFRECIFLFDLLFTKSIFRRLHWLGAIHHSSSSIRSKAVKLKRFVEEVGSWVVCGCWLPQKNKDVCCWVSCFFQKDILCYFIHIIRHLSLRT